MQLSILGWLLIPVAVTAVTFVVVALRARPKSPASEHEGVAEHVRFLAAMEKPLLGSERATPDLDPVTGSVVMNDPVGEHRVARGEGTGPA